MKKTTIIVLCIAFFFGAQASASYREQLEDHNIYTFIYHEKAQQEIIQQCPSESISKAFARKDSIQQYIQQLIERETPVQQRYKTKTLTKSIQKVIQTLPDTNKTKRCEIQRLLIEILKQLREQHLNIIYDNQMEHDFENIQDSEKIEGIEFKKALLEEKYTEYQRYEDLLKTNPIEVRGVENLSQDEQTLATPLINLTKSLMYYTIFNLQQAGIRTPQDIQELLPKTSIEYHPSKCEDYHGKVKVNYLLWEDGSVTDTKVQEIMIKVNGCYKLFTLENIDVLLKKIIAHELGGHITHYLKDQDFQKFQSICRESIDKRNNQCSDEDFVTPYAQTNAYEDFAETFTHLRLELEVPNNDIIRQKFNHIHNFINQQQN